MSLADQLIQEQKQFEARFIYAAMNYPDSVLAECAYIDQGNFADEQYGDYWAALKSANVTSIEGAVGLALEKRVFDRIDGGRDSILAGVAYREWADMIVKLSYMRRVLTKNSEIVKAVAGRDTDKIRSILDEISLGGDDSSGRKLGRVPEEIHGEFLETLDGPLRAIKTHIPGFDSVIGGFFPDELTIIASRPGIGKTALTLCCARTIAYSRDPITGNRRKVLYVSIEMARQQLWARMACGDVGIPWIKVRSGDATKEEIEKIKRASEALSKNLGEYLVIDDESWTISAIQQSVIKNKPDIVFVDQLSDILWRDPEQKPVEWYGLATSELRRSIARQLHIPVILIHQINRGPEDRRDKRPDLSDLRGSGELEQRADGVIGLYREDYYEGREATVTEVSIEAIPLKMRQGDTSRYATLNYDLVRQWFS